MSRPTHEMVEDNVMTWQVAVYELHREIDKLDQEKELLERWVADLQSGMYINCVYCGHQYGPKESTPISMADVLKEHISRCPKHPLSTANTRIQALEAAAKVAHQALLETMHAQSVGESWYTRGAAGLYNQVAMWVRKGLEALASVGVH